MKRTSFLVQKKKEVDSVGLGREINVFFLDRLSAGVLSELVGFLGELGNVLLCLCLQVPRLHRCLLFRLRSSLQSVQQRRLVNLPFSYLKKKVSRHI